MGEGRGKVVAGQLRVVAASFLLLFCSVRRAAFCLRCRQRFSWQIFLLASSSHFLSISHIPLLKTSAGLWIHAVAA